MLPRPACAEKLSNYQYKMRVLIVYIILLFMRVSKPVKPHF